MNRRDLLTSAAAMTIPSVPAIAAPPALVVNATILPRTKRRKLERAVAGYFAAFEAYWGAPFRPADSTGKAHQAESDRVVARESDFDDARKALIASVMGAHGLDWNKDNAPVKSLAVDVGELRLIVGPHYDYENDTGPPIGQETLLLMPLSQGMADRLDALPVRDPMAFASPEEKERLEYHSTAPPYNEDIELDRSRMPVGEPIPVKVGQQNITTRAGYVYLYRTWASREDAIACERCKCCPLMAHIQPEEHMPLMCTVHIPKEDVERVLYSPTPELDDDHRSGRGVLVDSAYERAETGKVTQTRFVVMRTKTWEASDLSKDARWVVDDTGPKGLVSALNVETGPVPHLLWKPWGDVPRETAPPVETATA